MASGLVVDIKAMRAQAKVVNTQKTAGVRPGEDFGPTAGTAPGVEVWRIEKLQVVPVDKRQHGKFYSGDSYIVLHTRARATKLVWDLYFWLGAATSQDEAAVAAYKTVELDNRLGGAPTQHRETQGHESAEFRAVFSSIQYLKGGVDSALRAASARGGKPEPRLLHCKGAKTVLVSEVEKKAASLNHVRARVPARACGGRIGMRGGAIHVFHAQPAPHRNRPLATRARLCGTRRATSTFSMRATWCTSGMGARRTGARRPRRSRWPFQSVMTTAPAARSLS